MGMINHEFDHINPIGEIRFNGESLLYFFSNEEPLFRISDVTDILHCTSADIVTICDETEMFKPFPVDSDDMYLTERGLYDVLAQSSNPFARNWRKVIITELIEARKNAGKTPEERFDDWDHRLDDIFWDNGLKMITTVPGGDIVVDDFTL